MEKELLITEEIANHELNAGFELNVGDSLLKDPVDKPCPADTSAGYYVKISGNCVFVPFG